MSNFTNKMFESMTDDMSKKINDSMFKIAKYNEEKSEDIGFENYSYWKSTWIVFTKNKVAMVVLFIILLTLLFTTIQPYLPNQKNPNKIFIDPATNVQARNTAPCDEYWFGTNSIGQDLWSRIWSGTRTSLMIGIIVGLWDTVLGITIGALWGYVKKLDRLITEIYNVLDNIPNTIVLILVSYIMRPSIFTIIIAMCVTGWLPMARFIRNQIIIIRDREYNLASRCLGTPTHRIILKNLLPYLVSVIMLRIALSIPAAIGREVFLTYIGLGLPPNIPSLGNLLNEGRVVMMSSQLRYQLIFPSIVLSIIAISFYYLGNSFADSADPRNHV